MEYDEFDVINVFVFIGLVRDGIIVARQICFC